MLHPSNGSNDAKHTSNNSISFTVAMVVVVVVVAVVLAMAVVAAGKLVAVAVAVEVVAVVVRDDSIIPIPSADIIFTPFSPISIFSSNARSTDGCSCSAGGGGMMVWPASTAVKGGCFEEC